jgi:hypothetical protein
MSEGASKLDPQEHLRILEERILRGCATRK